MATNSRPDALQDVAEAFTRQVLLPLAADAVRAFNGSRGDRESIPVTEISRFLDRGDASGETALSKAFGSNLSPERMIEVSDHWLEHRLGMDAEIGADIALGPWEPLFKTRMVAGLEAVSLSTVRDLEEEGFTEPHCLASYAWKCIGAGSHIVSLREQGGQRVAALEFKVLGWQSGAAPSLELSQLLPTTSRLPSQAAARAAGELLDGMRSGLIPVDWQHIEEHRLRRKEYHFQDALTVEAGYDPDDHEARDTALRLWAFALPPSDRDLSHAEWASKLGLPGMLLASYREHLADPEAVSRIAAWRKDRDADRTDRVEAAAPPARPLSAWLGKFRGWL